jgi:CheY-like chemotaxis protein
MFNHHNAQSTSPAQPLPLILVVEENEANAEMLRLVLSQELPCLVTCVNTGSEALQVVEMITPDLLVIDYDLREMPGPDLYHTLKMKPDLSSVPILCLSTNPLQGRGESQPSSFLAKPFDIEVLLKTVRHLLGM